MLNNPVSGLCLFHNISSCCGNELCAKRKLENKNYFSLGMPLLEFSAREEKKLQNTFTPGATKSEQSYYYQIYIAKCIVHTVFDGVHFLCADELEFPLLLFTSSGKFESHELFAPTVCQ